jgi:hypothetical protein
MSLQEYRAGLLANWFRELPIYKQLDLDQQLCLLNLVKFVRYSSEQVVGSIGQECKNIGILLQGKLALYNRQKWKYPIFVMEPGEYFGDNVLIDLKSHLFDIISMQSDTVVAYITPNEFQTLFKRSIQELTLIGMDNERLEAHCNKLKQDKEWAKYQKKEIAKLRYEWQCLGYGK